MARGKGRKTHSGKSHTAKSGGRHGGKGAGGNQYWLTGLHPVRAALANPERTVGRLLATAEAAPRIADAAAERSVRIETVDKREIDRLSGPDRVVHQGVALEVAPLEPAVLEDALFSIGPDGVILVLDQVTDPHNVGAILRSAAVFGSVGVVMQDRHAPPETSTLAKSSSGGLESVPIVRVPNLARALEAMKNADIWCVGFDGEADEDLRTLPAGRPLALILGAEGEGMRRLTREACDQLVRIPMAPNGVGSLNVSNAAAVGLYAAYVR